MNWLVFFISVLSSLSLHATERFDDVDREPRISAPHLKYNDIKEQIQDQQPWQEIKIKSPSYNDEQTWHLHWHISKLAKLEEQFPPHQYTYEITRLKDIDPVRPLLDFAIYQISIQNKRTSQHIETPPYIFYLTDPRNCFISHYPAY